MLYSCLQFCCYVKRLHCRLDVGVRFIEFVSRQNRFKGSLHSCVMVERYCRYIQLVGENRVIIQSCRPNDCIYVKYDQQTFALPYWSIAMKYSVRDGVDGFDSQTGEVLSDSVVQLQLPTLLNGIRVVCNYSFCLVLIIPCHLVDCLTYFSS